jgi:hypothetical protein
MDTIPPETRENVIDTPVKHLKATARVVTNVECMNSNVLPMYRKER